MVELAAKMVPSLQHFSTYVRTLRLLLSMIMCIIRKKMSHPLRLCITAFVHRKVMEELFNVKHTCTFCTWA